MVTLAFILVGIMLLIGLVLVAGLAGGVYVGAKAFPPRSEDTPPTWPPRSDGPRSTGGGTPT